jgi:hypothetical protein
MSDDDLLDIYCEYVYPNLLEIRVLMPKEF